MSTKVEYLEDVVTEETERPTYTLRGFRGIFIGVLAGATMWAGIIALILHLR
jgi:hypothetical protein